MNYSAGSSRGFGRPTGKIRGMGTEPRRSISGGKSRVTSQLGGMGKKVVSMSVKHVCSVCSKEFQTQSGLWKHSSVHTGKFSYNCSVWQRLQWETHVRRAYEHARGNRIHVHAMQENIWTKDATPSTSKEVYCCVGSRSPPLLHIHGPRFQAAWCLRRYPFRLLFLHVIMLITSLSNVDHLKVPTLWKQSIPVGCVPTAP